MTRLSEMPTAEVMALITRRHISPAAARAFRERRGLTHEQMADTLGASPGEVAAWEAGTVQVPSAQAYQVRVLAQAARWGDGLDPGTRLPWCPWVNAHLPDLHDILWREAHEVTMGPLVRQHLDECSECRRVVELRDAARAQPARKRGATELRDDVGPVMSLTESLLFLCMAVALPAAGIAGAVFVSEVSGVGADVWFAGSTGFLAFEIARRVVRAGLSRRPYTAGLVMAVSGMLAAMLTWTLQDPQDNLFGPLGLAGCAVVALLAGLLTGWMRDGYEVDDYEADEAGADHRPDAHRDAASRAETDDAPPSVLLATPDPLAALDEARERRYLPVIEARKTARNAAVQPAALRAFREARGWTQRSVPPRRSTTRSNPPPFRASARKDGAARRRWRVTSTKDTHGRTPFHPVRVMPKPFSPRWT